MKKTQRLLATAMTPLLILHCLLTPLSVWADSLPVQPESTDYSNSAASSSEDESFVLNDEQQGVEVEQPTVSDNDSPSSVSSESASNATDSPKPENDVSAVFGSVSYQTHVQDIGWQAPVSNEMTAGTTGRAKRVEALKINLLSQDGTPLGNDSISVQSHISGIGWEPQPVGNGQTSGTVGQSRAIEAIKLSLSGGLSDSYDIWYRVHSANVGWLGWASNGEPAGTQGYAYQIEAIQIKVLPKNAQDAPREAMPLGTIPRNRLLFPIDLISPMLDGWVLSRTERHRGSLTQEMQSRHCRLVLIGMATEALFPLARTSLALVGKAGLQVLLARPGSLGQLSPFSLSSMTRYLQLTTFGTVCMLPNWADGWAGRPTGLLRARWGRVPPFRVFRLCWSKRAALLLEIQRIILLELRMF